MAPSRTKADIICKTSRKKKDKLNRGFVAESKEILSLGETLPGYPPLSGSFIKSLNENNLDFLILLK